MSRSGKTEAEAAGATSQLMAQDTSMSFWVGVMGWSSWFCDSCICVPMLPRARERV